MRKSKLLPRRTQRAPIRRIRRAPRKRLLRTFNQRKQGMLSMRKEIKKRLWKAMKTVVTLRLQKETILKAPRMSHLKIPLMRILKVRKTISHRTPQPPLLIHKSLPLRKGIMKNMSTLLRLKWRRLSSSFRLLSLITRVLSVRPRLKKCRLIFRILLMKMRNA